MSQRGGGASRQRLDPDHMQEIIAEGEPYYVDLPCTRTARPRRAQPCALGALELELELEYGPRAPGRGRAGARVSQGLRKVHFF